MNKIKNFWEFHKTLTPALRLASGIAAAIIAIGYLALVIASNGIILIITLALATLVSIVVVLFIVIDKYDDYKRDQRYKNRGW